MSKKGKPVIHVVAQSHIDLAWLWRWDPETVQVCCKKTFGKATDNLDKFPEYMFTQSQVPLYQATEQHHAEIFKKIEAGIKAGRWEIAGGMYVEAEGGEPSGESLVRQCVLGKRYFKQRFGIDVTTGWQEDSWSHPWQLPQIFKKCGIDAYMFKRGKRNPCIFWWEAPDGSKVLAIKPLHALKGFGFWIFDWGEVLKWTERCKSEYGLNEIMVRIGEGDHGGGPRSDEIEAVRSWAEEYKESMDVRFDTFKDYKDVVLANPGNFPTVKNELDFELQGDLTDCCEIKRRNRLCEVLLLSAEKVSIIAKSAASFEYPERELQGAWEKLLFNQFHDILGGSGIPEVNADAHADYDKIEKISCTCIENALAAMTSTIDTRSKDKSAVPLVIFNPLSWDRVETVEWSFTIPSYAEGIQVTDAKGISISHQEIKRVFTKDSITIDFTFEARVPAMGHTVYHVMHAGILPAPKSAFIVQDGDPFVMESQTFRIEIDRPTGNISRAFDKIRRRELLDNSGRGNCLVAIEDHGDSEGRFEKGNDLVPRPTGAESDICFDTTGGTGLASIKVTENGPLRASIELVKRYQSSTFTQRITMHASIPRIDFDLDIDWHDVHRMIKVAFPLQLANPIVTYHTAYGTISRPADSNEYPAQYWVDLSTKDLGIALLNNTRYAHDARGSTLRMSILRSPTEPANNNEEGKHSMRYSIFPHGDWKNSGVMRKGYEFNHPLLARATDQHVGNAPPEQSFFTIDASNVIVEVVKKAFDFDALVVRMFEFEGKATAASITGSFLTTGVASETDLLERPIKEIPIEHGKIVLEFSPFEIKTIIIS